MNTKTFFPCGGRSNLILATYTHLTSNIDIYLSALVFIENIGHNYDFGGDGVVSVSVWGWGWSRSKETTDFHKINSYLLTMNVYINFSIKYVTLRSAKLGFPKNIA